MTPEEFIKECTRGCSNELVAVEDRNGKDVISYHEWLTPDQALKAVEMAREQMLTNAFEWEVVDAAGLTFIGEYICQPVYSIMPRSMEFKAGDKVKVIIVKED